MAIILDGTNGVTTNSGTLISASTIGVGGATPSASGAGITFPATQSASTDANTLDDYEEGTWAPNVGGNATYNVQVGNYVKIGRLVYARGSMTINTIGTGTQNYLTGLPFALASVSVNGGAMASIGYWANFATNVIAIYAAADGGSTNLYFGSKSSSGNTIDWTTNVFGNNARVDFNITYYAAA